MHQAHTTNKMRLAMDRSRRRLNCAAGTHDHACTTGTFGHASYHPPHIRPIYEDTKMNRHQG